MSTEMSLSQKLLKIQQTIGKVYKSNTNTYFKSRYVDLNSVLEVSKEALNSLGIYLMQEPNKNEFGAYLQTTLVDASSGECVFGRVYFSGQEEDMQKIGAAITYARRIGLISLLALESEDDDGETAVGRGYNAKVGARDSNTKQNGASTAGSSSGVANAAKAASVQSSGKASSGAFPTRKTINDQISLTSKILIDKGTLTNEAAIAMLTKYGVTSKDNLTDPQASELLATLKSKLGEGAVYGK